MQWTDDQYRVSHYPGGMVQPGDAFHIEANASLFSEQAPSLVELWAERNSTDKTSVAVVDDHFELFENLHVELSRLKEPVEAIAAQFGIGLADISAFQKVQLRNERHVTFDAHARDWQRRVLRVSSFMLVGAPERQRHQAFMIREDTRPMDAPALPSQNRYSDGIHQVVDGSGMVTEISFVSPEVLRSFNVLQATIDLLL